MVRLTKTTRCPREPRGGRKARLSTSPGGGGDPHFKKKIAREKAEGGTGFVAIGEKQRFLDDMSLRIARGNAGMVLAAAVAACRAQRSSENTPLGEQSA